MIKDVNYWKNNLNYGNGYKKRKNFLYVDALSKHKKLWMLLKFS